METCEWTLYKGLYHKECNSFLTTTLFGDLVYAKHEIPFDGKCDDCGKEIIVTDKKLGRMRKDGE